MNDTIAPHDPVEWGKPDRSLARAACESIANVTVGALPIHRNTGRIASICGWCMLTGSVLGVLMLAAAGVNA